MTLYPLIITFADVVQVGAAMARVHGDTKVLGEFDGDTWTLSAVAAGGITARGATSADAYQAFRRELRLVIEDSIEPGLPFTAFENEVRCVFTSVDPMIERQWDEALESLRSGELKAADGVEVLPTKRTTETHGVRVARLPNQQATDDSLWLAQPRRKAA